jgi:thiol-disulfide isomerase/thioredoxin
MIALPAAALAQHPQRGEWRAALDLDGGPLRFHIVIEDRGGDVVGRMCNGSRCQPFASVSQHVGAEDSLFLEIAEFDAWIRARAGGDSLVGFYRNVGNRGPRIIPFRASRGRWSGAAPGPRLAGRWDAWWVTDGRASPRVIELRRGSRGLEGTIISNSGDYGLFAGTSVRDSFDISHFDGSFVYRLTGRLTGDTIRGVFHAGLRTRTPFVAWRSRGELHLTPPSQVVRMDTSAPFSFSFPDLDGVIVSSSDERFRGKVVIADIFGTWCPTCHDAAPLLVELHNRFAAQGLEIVGLAYEVTGDTAIDGELLRRYRDKFGIRFPLLLAGVNDGESPAATQPQLSGPIAFPTTIFIDRSGRVRRIHAGFYGPATGRAHEDLRRSYIELVERLVNEGR